MERLHIIFMSCLLSWLFPVSGSSQQEAGKVNRSPAVAGSFYPAQPQELRNTLKSFFDHAGKLPDIQPLALIVPHAGYLFSGQVAASGFRQLDPERTYRHIFVIGPNHRVYLEGSNIYTKGDFVTPLGVVPVDPLARELVAKNRIIDTDPAAQRQEHCIEVQLPFLQYWLKKPFSIIPVLIGGESPENARQLAAMLAPYFNDENLFIISADFSHYPDYETAVKADELTANAIASNNPSQFIQVKNRNESNFGPELATSICGWMPALTLLYLTEKDKTLEYHKILYQNSGDSRFGDKEKVVGYWSIAVTRNKPEESSADFRLSDSDKISLLKLARHTIDTYLQYGTIPAGNEKACSANLLEKTGAFVTLRKNKELRGCIGNFISDKPLYRTIQEMAIAAATRDSRFNPVEMNEMKQIEIEISVLTPLRRINSISEFKLGRDGIYMKKGNRSGTFLPQVADETGWSTEEFMGHCARDKAFIGWEGWKEKDTELYTYQALVFEEAEFSSALHKKK